VPDDISKDDQASAVAEHPGGGKYGS
jgi:hypothetical protein